MGMFSPLSMGVIRQNPANQVSKTSKETPPAVAKHILAMRSREPSGGGMGFMPGCKFLILSKKPKAVYK